MSGPKPGCPVQNGRFIGLRRALSGSPHDLVPVESPGPPLSGRNDPSVRDVSLPSTSCESPFGAGLLVRPEDLPPHGSSVRVGGHPTRSGSLRFKWEGVPSLKFLGRTCPGDITN